MAFPTYTQEYRSIDPMPAVWRVEIFDANSVPLGEFWMGPTGVRFNYQGLTRELKPQVYPLSVEFDYMVRFPFHESLLDFIREEPESRFVVKVYRDNTLYFVGRFNSENIVYEDAPRPYSTKLVVGDGLNALKNVQYNGASPMTIKELIVECLQAMGIHEEYPAGTPFFSVELNPYTPVGYASATNVFENLRLANVLGWRGDRPDEPATYYDILTEICKAFGMRLIYSFGRFQFETLAKITRAGGTGITFSNYDRDGANLVFDTRGTDRTVDISAIPRVHPLAGGSWRHIAPLAKVCMVHKYNQNNIGQGFTWSNTDTAEKLIGLLDVKNDKQRIRIEAGLYVNTTANIPVTEANWHNLQNHRYVVDLKFKIGSGGEYGLRNRLDAEESFFISNLVRQYEDAKFQVPFNVTQSAIAVFGERLRWSEPTETPITLELNQTTATNVVRSDLLQGPLATGQYEIRVQPNLVGVYNEGGVNIASSPDYDFEWEVRWIKVVILEDGTEQDDGQPLPVAVEYCTTNDQEGNYEELSIDTILGDAPNNRQGLQWRENSSSDWKYTQTWDKTGGLVDQKPLLKLISEDLMRLRYKTKRLYVGQMIDKLFDQNTRYVYDGVILQPLRGIFNTAEDFYQGEFIEAEEDDISSIPAETPVIMQDPDQIQITPIENPDPPIGQTDAPSNLVTAEGIAVGSVLTGVDISNVDDEVIPSGSFVAITNSLGNSQVVQLTAAIIATSTSMSFVQTTFNEPYQTGSAITLSIITDFKTRSQLYVATGGETAITVNAALQPMADPQFVPADQAHEWYEVYMGGSRMNYNAIPLTDVDQFGVDPVAQQITFAIPLLSGQKVLIITKTPL